jgi:hypothetical protein
MARRGSKGVLRRRLDQEIEMNVSLKAPMSSDSFCYPAARHPRARCSCAKNDAEAGALSGDQFCQGPGIRYLGDIRRLTSGGKPLASDATMSNAIWDASTTDDCATSFAGVRNAHERRMMKRKPPRNRSICVHSPRARPRWLVNEPGSARRLRSPVPALTRKRGLRVIIRRRERARKL